MNIYPFRFLIGEEKRGAALKFVEQLRTAETFKHARFDVFVPRAATGKVIVCLGQKHTVHQGKITKWGAKSIAKVQARLFEYYRYFHHKWNVHSFGAEGAIANGKGSKFKYHDELLEKALLPKEIAQLKAEDEAVHLDTVTKILKRLAIEWYRKMKIFGHDLNYGQQEIAPYAAAVNGLRLYNYLAENVSFYPIEGESAYMQVSAGVKKNQDEMIRMESDLNYRSARSKKGKNLTQAEYDAMVKYGQLVKDFNKAIKSNYREKASLALALENLGHADEGELSSSEASKVGKLAITVFTMGIGHRTNYKWLVPRYLKTADSAFVLITAPELWWWKHVVGLVFKVFVFSAVLGGVWWYFYA